MSETIACLVRVGDNIKKNKLIKLDREQITVGRSGDVNYTLLSTMISRCHAIFKQQDGKWTITDNKSLNGVFVNGRHLTPFKACVMENGDMVQFGVPTSPDTPAEFVYKYHASLKVRILKDGAKKARKDSDCQSENAASQNESDPEDVSKKKNPVPSSSRMNDNPETEVSTASSREAEYQAKLAHMEKLLHEKELKQSEVEKQLQIEKEEREKRMKEVEELRLNEQAILMEMQDNKDKLEREKEELKQRMQAELEANLREKEQALISQLADQKRSLLEEKKRIEESLQEEMAKALEVKNKEVEERLISMKENLEKVIEKKDNDQKILETRLNQTKEENESAKLQALKAREDVLSSFVDLMEMELQCTICNELFIKATALNCAHVFCKLCISQWMKVKKECPNCRMKITTHMQALALDSYIEKMVEQLSDELKESRKTLLGQRKVEQDKFDAGPSATTTPQHVPGLPTPANQTRGRGRSRGGRNNRGRNNRGGGAYAARQPTNAYIPQITPIPTSTVLAARTTTGTYITNAPMIYAGLNVGRNAIGGAPTINTATMYTTGARTRGARSGPNIRGGTHTGVNTVNTTAMYAGGAFTRGAVAGPNIRGGRTTTTAQPVVFTNPLIMAVAAPPTPSTATQALRSLLGVPPLTMSSAPSTDGSGHQSVSTSVTSMSSNTSGVLNVATTGTVTPIVVDSDSTNTTTPIVVNDTSNEATPIEVSDGDGSTDEDEEENDRLLYERDRYRRRRRYWLESDTEEEDGSGTNDSEGNLNSSDASVEGVRTEYYGGYGRCFSCGRRGHWANGCPF